MIELLYGLTALELFVGGGGRLLEIGPVTLRMLLFALCLLASVWLMASRRRLGAMALALAFAAVYLLLHLTGMLHGLLRGATVADVFLEVQPSLYWLMAPFFAALLESRHMVLRTANLLRLAGILLAIAYLATLTALLLGSIEFAPLYAALDESGEFFFRGESYFFYKGFLYLAIGSVFLLAHPGRLSVPWLLLMLSALVLTLTRGFLLATAVAIVLMLFARRRWGAMAIAVAVTAPALFVGWVYLPGLSDDLLDQRESSTSTRLDDMLFMLDHADPLTLLVGQGFGAYIKGRLNIENSFLWLAWKLGLPALLFWLTPLLLGIHYYRRIPRRHTDHGLASAFMFSMALVYLQTATNPYLNNPIGLSFVLIALFSLRALALPVPRLRQRTVAPRAGPSRLVPT